MSRMPGALDFNPSFYHQEALHEAALRRQEHAARNAHRATSTGQTPTQMVPSTFKHQLVAVAAGLITVLGIVALI